MPNSDSEDSDSDTILDEYGSDCDAGARSFSQPLSREELRTLGIDESDEGGWYVELPFPTVANVLVDPCPCDSLYCVKDFSPVVLEHEYSGLMDSSPHRLVQILNDAFNLTADPPIVGTLFNAWWTQLYDWLESDDHPACLRDRLKRFKASLCRNQRAQWGFPDVRSLGLCVSKVVHGSDPSRACVIWRSVSGDVGTLQGASQCSGCGPIHPASNRRWSLITDDTTTDIKNRPSLTASAYERLGVYEGMPCRELCINVFNSLKMNVGGVGSLLSDGDFNSPDPSPYLVNRLKRLACSHMDELAKILEFVNEMFPERDRVGRLAVSGESIGSSTPDALTVECIAQREFESFPNDRVKVMCWINLLTGPCVSDPGWTVNSFSYRGIRNCISFINLSSNCSLTSACDNLTSEWP